jgi:hypothetical protein
MYLPPLNAIRALEQLIGLTVFENGQGAGVVNRAMRQQHLPPSI